MRFTALAAVAALASGASAVTINVLVGFNSTLTFNPPAVTANVGDEVLFTFVSKNHSATQSSFGSPCAPLAGGMNSGFNNISGIEATLPQWGFTVNVTTPTWWYCAQTIPKVHCTTGMVFAVNPTAAKSFDSFQAAAMGLPAPAAPGTGGTTGQPAGASTLTRSNAAIVGSLGLLAGLLLW